jgi:hypothetical protein
MSVDVWWILVTTHHRQGVLVYSLLIASTRSLGCSSVEAGALAICYCLVCVTFLALFLEALSVPRKVLLLSSPDAVLRWGLPL